MIEVSILNNSISNLVPVITPFNDDLSIDLVSTMSHAVFLKNAGVKSVVVGGTTGEGLSLKAEEKAQISNLFKELGFTVVGCIASFDWVSTIESIKAFESAEYLLVMPPMFIKPSKGDIIDFFNFVKKRSNKELILYNNPSRTGVDISKLYNRYVEFSNILGVKETNFESIPMVPWWCGEDLSAIMCMNKGAFGLISASANVFPTIAQKICERIQSEEEIIKWFNYVQAIFKLSNPLGVKYLLKKKGIIKSDKTRFSISIRDAKILDRIELDDIK